MNLCRFWWPRHYDRFSFHRNWMTKLDWRLCGMKQSWPFLDPRSDTTLHHQAPLWGWYYIVLLSEQCLALTHSLSLTVDSSTVPGGQDDSECKTVISLLTQFNALTLHCAFGHATSEKCCKCARKTSICLTPFRHVGGYTLWYSACIFLMAFVCAWVSEQSIASGLAYIMAYMFSQWLFWLALLTQL